MGATISSRGAPSATPSLEFVLFALHLHVLNLFVSRLLRQSAPTCIDRDRLAPDPRGRLDARSDHRVRAGTRTGRRFGRTRSVRPLSGMSVVLRQTLTVFGLSPRVAYAVR